METGAVVIYHAGCPDGMAAAWMFTPAAGVYKKPVQFYAAHERNFFKDVNTPRIAGRDVYIVDFSYPRPDLVLMASIARSIVVIDHHESAREELAGPHPDNVSVIFNMEKCGAELTFDYVHATFSSVGVILQPVWLSHIADRDLWRWSNPNSKAFAEIIFDYGLKFETFDMINKCSLDDLEKLYARGRALLEFANREITRIANRAILVNFEGYRVLCVESHDYRSEVGNVLAGKENVDFSAVYRYDLKTDTWWISLRATKNSKNINLIPIAAKYGGGGHPLACGMSYCGVLREIFRKI